MNRQNFLFELYHENMVNSLHSGKKTFFFNMEITFKYELVNDKPTKLSAHPAKVQISLCICPVWSVFATGSIYSYKNKSNFFDSQL